MMHRRHHSPPCALGCAVHCTPHCTPRSRGPQTAGFTLLELLTVIGIIAVLTGIVAVAFSVVGNNSSARQTRVQLENCKGLQGEYESTVKLPVGLLASLVAADDLDVANSANPSNPDQSQSQTFEAPATTALSTTAGIMATLTKSPKNKSSIDASSPSSLQRLTPIWVNGVSFDVGDVVGVSTTPPSYAYFICIQATNSQPTTNAAFWSPITSAPIVPMDGWGRGIRFVGTGLVNVRVDPNGTKGWYGTTTPPAGFTQVGVSVHAPNNRPFWVSAGPDGKFSTHDDNVYSFEN